MKEANNGIDFLLRLFAHEGDPSRVQRGSVRDSEEASSDHLDADEMNSFAEGILPAAARPRCVAHLADCDDCRRIVIGLTQSTGAIHRHEVSESHHVSSFWRRLAGFFSPPVLRYAVPALVLTGVIGLGLLALRQQRQPQFIASNQTPVTQSPVTQSSDAGSSLKPTEPPATNENGTQLRGTPPATNKVGKLQDEKTQTGQSREVPAVGQKALGKDAGETPAGAPDSIAELRPSYAPEPKAGVAAPKVAPDAQKSEVSQVQSANRDEWNRARNEYKNQPIDDVHGPQRSANNAAVPGNGRSAGLMSARSPSADKNKKAEEVETRTISGRHFVKQGDSWVDTAYESSRATIRVKRDSEQFRALVADEPGIRTIVEQLSGVVIVVWKGLAYRIQ